MVMLILLAVLVVLGIADLCVTIQLNRLMNQSDEYYSDLHSIQNTKFDFMDKRLSSVEDRLLDLESKELDFRGEEDE